MINKEELNKMTLKEITKRICELEEYKKNEIELSDEHIEFLILEDKRRKIIDKVKNNMHSETDDLRKRVLHAVTVNDYGSEEEFLKYYLADLYDLGCSAEFTEEVEYTLNKIQKTKINNF